LGEWAALTFFTVVSVISRSPWSEMPLRPPLQRGPGSAVPPGRSGAFINAALRGRHAAISLHDAVPWC
jgi:hypothetical protein